LSLNNGDSKKEAILCSFAAEWFLFAALSAANKKEFNLCALSVSSEAGGESDRYN
jgi:hypothetical protein